MYFYVALEQPVMVKMNNIYLHMFVKIINWRITLFTAYVRNSADIFEILIILIGL